MTTKPTKKPVKKGPPFGYGTPTEAKKSAAPSTPTITLKEVLNKLDMPGLRKVE